jgi:hypothetical protein
MDCLRFCLHIMVTSSLNLHIKKGMDSVLERAPWHMANRPLVLKGWWHSNLILFKEDLISLEILI